MTDPIRLLDQSLDFDVRRAIEAARSAEPPAMAHDRVWNALSVALPAGVLLGATTTTHAAAAVASAEAAGITTAGAGVGAASAGITTAGAGVGAASAGITTAGAGVGAASAGITTAGAGVGAATSAVAAKTGLALIATKAIAIGLGVGLTAHTVSGVVVRAGSTAPAHTVMISAKPTAPKIAEAQPQRCGSVEVVEDRQAAEPSLMPDTPTPLARNAESKSEKPLPFEEPTIDELREESALLVLVRQAVNSSRSTQALQLIAQHQQRFAGGRLIQERDALEVQALSKLGQAARARARAKDFLVRYPDSPYRETIAALVRAEPSSE